MIADFVNCSASRKRVERLIVRIRVEPATVRRRLLFVLRVGQRSQVLRSRTRSVSSIPAVRVQDAAEIVRAARSTGGTVSVRARTIQGDDLKIGE